jgi:hypothetical protein
MIVDPDGTEGILDRIMEGFGWKGRVRRLWWRVLWVLFRRRPFTGVRYSWLEDDLEPRP